MLIGKTQRIYCVVNIHGVVMKVKPRQVHVALHFAFSQEDVGHLAQ